MSMEFEFVAGPVSEDGDLREIVGDDLRPGFSGIETIGLPKIRGNFTVRALGLNNTGVENLNEITNGAFSAFIDGTLNQRYLRIAPRLPLLYALKEALPHIEHVFYRMWAETFVENCEHALEAHGDQAILLIY